MHSHAIDAASQPPVRSGWLVAFQNRWVRSVAALACVLFGIFITLSIWAEPGSPVVVDGGKLVASSRLYQVLNDPSIGAREGNPTVGKGFTDKSGRNCHTFVQGPINGTVCRVEEEWRVIELRQG
ncbi:MAG: hypothetical protein CVT77_06185 [Alphaproteobacteria bacterium HGW-Alphaproteobacteria-16]|nr:MAG: hypothetical protein CVT77_06185 [Alphaproteobacteria bacterium HGW-Alphaproteobacteria-16]